MAEIDGLDEFAPSDHVRVIHRVLMGDTRREDRVETVLQRWWVHRSREGAAPDDDPVAGIWRDEARGHG